MVDAGRPPMYPCCNIGGILICTTEGYMDKPSSTFLRSEGILWRLQC